MRYFEGFSCDISRPLIAIFSRVGPRVDTSGAASYVNTNPALVRSSNPLFSEAWKMCVSC